MFLEIFRLQKVEWELRRFIQKTGFAHIAGGPVRRYELRNLKAFNFIIENALDGGVTISIAQDVHGKGLSNVMLGIELPDRN